MYIYIYIYRTLHIPMSGTEPVGRPNSGARQRLTAPFLLELCMYILMCIHVCIYIYTYIERDIHIYVYVYMYTSLSLYIYIYIYTCIFI